jgi:hypothetical protein
MTGVAPNPVIRRKCLLVQVVLETVVHSWQLTGFFRPEAEVEKNLGSVVFVLGVAVPGLGSGKGLSTHLLR